MKKKDVEENVPKERCFIMEEYTEFLRRYLGEHRDITKKVFKIVGKIYKSVKKREIDKQID